MYRILINKPNISKDTYQLLKVKKETIDDTTGEVVSISQVPFGTDDLEELQNKYKELLNTYTMSQLIPIEELKVALEATIEDLTEE